MSTGPFAFLLRTITKGNLRRSGFSAKILLLLLSLFVALFSVEVALRIHNPFNKYPRERHGRVLLPSGKEVKYRMKVPGLPEVVERKRNSLGFRGNEPPEDFEAWLTVITVGGSTTESGYLSDGLTWTDGVAQRLSKCLDRFWINNAGFDGHTTHGHLELLQGYLVDLKPDVIVFLFGRNDSTWPEASRFDRGLGTLGSGPVSFASFREFIKSVGERSESVTTALMLYRWLRTKRHGGWAHFVDWTSMEEGDRYPPGGKENLATHREVHIPQYKMRIERIISICRAHGILVVFATQPMPFSSNRDPDTGKDLSRLMFGAYEIERLELYNSALREVAMAHGVPLIDLARQMPKRTSLYFDVVHFTLPGEVLVADIVSRELLHILNESGAQSKVDCL